MKECQWCLNSTVHDVLPVNYSQGNPLLRCSYCKVVSHKTPLTLQDSILLYDEDYYWENEGTTRLIGVLETISRFLRKNRAKYITKYSVPGKILDIGCGRGLLLHELKKMGWDVTGTHVLPDTAANIEKQLNIPIKCGDLLDLDLSGNTYDCITMWHVLEHLPHPGLTLQKISKLLTDKAILIIAVPNVAAPGAKWGKKMWLGWDPPYHLHHFSPASLTRILRDNGFQIRTINHFSLEFNPFTLLQTWCNMLTDKYNLLFSWMRGLVSRQQAWPAIILGALLAPAALAISTIGSLMQEGENITIVAQKMK